MTDQGRIAMFGERRVPKDQSISLTSFVSLLESYGAKIDSKSGSAHTNVMCPAAQALRPVELPERIRPCVAS